MINGGTMIDTGDNTVHFTKMKASQMAEIKSVLKNRPKTKFSVSLSPEAQTAMQQAQEDAKIQEAAKRGKRGSRGNVLFSDTVHFRQEVISPFSPRRRPSYTDIYGQARLEDNSRRTPVESLDVRSGLRASSSWVEPGSPRRCHGRRRSSVSKWVSERPVSESRTMSETDEVDQVISANLAPGI